MPFKRKSDSHTYATLWWAAALLLYMWLVYYGYSKIKDVASREFYTQIKAITLTPEQMFGSFPDIVFCTNGGQVGFSEREADYSLTKGVNYNLSELELSSEAVVEATPCRETGWHDFVTIFSLKNAPINMATFDYLIFDICPRNGAVTGNFLNPAIVRIIPNQANPYARAYGSPRPVDVPPSLNLNTYKIHQNASDEDIHVQSKATRLIRSGIWGLFGASEAELEYSISSTLSSSSSHRRCSKIRVIMSPVFQNDTQILVTSIPAAFAAWTGSFSGAWAIFYVFFGSTRLNPFGLISRLIGRKTQRYITNSYGHWSWSSKPQESTAKNLSTQRTSTSQRSSFNEKTARRIDDPSLKVSSSASLDLTARDAADVAERGEPQEENSIDVKVERLQEQLDESQKDIRKLHDLLQDYYLEMELTETESLQTDDRPWYRRFWPLKSGAGDGNNSPVMPLEKGTNQA